MDKEIDRIKRREDWRRGNDRNGDGVFRVLRDHARKKRKRKNKV